MAPSSRLKAVTHASLKNHFLIALRDLQEDYFSNTVTYIIEHNDDGAFGVVINRPTELGLGDLFDDIPGAQECLTEVLDGGPVGSDRVFFLHGSEVEYEYTQPISDEINLTTSLDIVYDIIAGKSPSNLVTILGYAGWDAGQLERELAENVWLISPANSSVIFDIPHELKPQAAAGLLGVDLNLVSTIAGHG